MARAGMSKQPDSAEVLKLEAEFSEKIPGLEPIGAIGIYKLSYKTITEHWKSLFGVMSVYLILYIVFVSNFGNLGTTATNIKNQINSSATGTGDKFSLAIRGYSDLAGGSNMTQVNSIMQNILLVITSLAIIWSLRRLIAGKKVSVKSAYYNSTKPLIPFILIIFVLFLELLPMTLGSAILAAIMVNFFGKSALIIAIFTVLIAILVAWSIYMIVNSIFALYIVTLPDMQPIRSLRAAKRLVQGRRWIVLGNLAALLGLLLILSSFVVISLILIATPLAPYSVTLLGAAMLLFAHTYLFNFYRSLI